MANLSPPPDENKFEHSEQCGQMKPDMFSTIPRIGIRAFLQHIARINSENMKRRE